MRLNVKLYNQLYKIRWELTPWNYYNKKIIKIMVPSGLIINLFHLMFLHMFMLKNLLKILFYCLNLTSELFSLLFWNSQDKKYILLALYWLPNRSMRRNENFGSNAQFFNQIVRFIFFALLNDSLSNLNLAFISLRLISDSFHNILYSICFLINMIYKYSIH